MATLNSSITIKLTSSQKQNVLVPQNHYPRTLGHQLPPPHYAVTAEVMFHFQILRLPHLVLHLKQKEKHTHTHIKFNCQPTATLHTGINMSQDKTVNIVTKVCVG